MPAFKCDKILIAHLYRESPSFIYPVENSLESFMMLNDQSLAENFRDICPEHVDLSYEEFLVQQEIVYESILAGRSNKGGTSNHGQKGESSHGGSVDSQLARDEALARSLQEDFDDFSITEHTSNAAGSTDIPRETSIRAGAETLSQDDVDPDDMTYEQLQSLGETIGSESRGLPEHVISKLPTFKYKTGLFSKKKKKDQQECVICHSAYKNGAWIVTLPCSHHYHTECISRWLTIKNNCPVCQAEVRNE